eukprot:4977038-Alexandrium_andersonii.AAC.1
MVALACYIKVAGEFAATFEALQAKANAFSTRPELDAALFSLTEVATDMDLDPLTVVRAVLHSPFDRAGWLRFLVAYRHDEIRIDVLRFPVEVPSPPPG